MSHTTATKNIRVHHNGDWSGRAIVRIEQPGGGYVGVEVAAKELRELALMIADRERGQNHGEPPFMNDPENPWKPVPGEPGLWRRSWRGCMQFNLHDRHIGYIDGEVPESMIPGIGRLFSAGRYEGERRARERMRKALGFR